MVFWKKEAALDVVKLMRDVEMRIGAIRGLVHQKEILLKVIKEIDDELDEVRASIARRAIEEKSKPWIDSKYDPVIDSMAAKEIEHVNNIESALAVYAGLADESKSEEELSHSIDGLMEEAQEIIKRDHARAREIEFMIRDSLRKNLTKYSDPVPAGKTKDGVSFTDVLEVARQLGGWGVGVSGGGTYMILFPNSRRQVFLSRGADSRVIAKDMVHQLRSSLPPHKVPSDRQVREWLKRGKAA